MKIATLLTIILFSQVLFSQSKHTGEKHLNNFRQLTFGGENAEAYWSFDGTKIVCQRTLKKEGVDCDQIYYAQVFEKINDGSYIFNSPDFKSISGGKGRTTCAYFLRGDTSVIFSSTNPNVKICPIEPPKERGKYLWPLYPEYELFIADLKGNIIKQLTNNNCYDAEAVVSPKGDRILFTSDRTGDLELFTMNIDGSDVKQITNQEGYDGGAFFSPDGNKIVWRATEFKSDSDRIEYRTNLKKHLVSPMNMEIYVANADGSERKKITSLGAANWAPFFHPSGEKVIFSSNHKTKAIPFNLYMVTIETGEIEQITFDPVFDSFPMFSPDGKKLIFCSNRNNGGGRDTNIFIADWKD